MASITGASICRKSVSCYLKQNQQPSSRFSSLRSVSLPTTTSGKSCFPSLKKSSKGVSHLQICCVAKAQTVEKLCEIVKNQLDVPEETEVKIDSSFLSLGGDTVDTAEIVTSLEEEFLITVEDEIVQTIRTIQYAVDLIEKLVEKK